MNRRIEALYRDGVPDAAAVERFVASEKFPLVEPDRVTFVYRGRAEEVYLRCWISGISTAQPLQPLEGTELWAATMELPSGSRIEYKYERVLDGQRQLVLDELNPVRAHDPFGANSVCQAHGYERPDWTLHDSGSRPGNLEPFDLDSAAFGGRQELQLYIPARFRRNRVYPLLVVHDGQDYLRYAALRTVLDNLIHRLEIPAMIVALTQPSDRLGEYAASPDHARFLAEDVLPAIKARYPIASDRSAHGLLGASLGAVAALHAASRYPGVFGQLLLQSGSFAFSDLGHHRKGPAFDPVVRFVNRYRAKPYPLAGKVYVSCGIYESLIYENRSLVPVLQNQGMEVRYEEARDAHNWENWRDRLRQGLSWLFPGPLWMVYE